jgi:Mg2+/Co2+ transporter CorB
VRGINRKFAIWFAVLTLLVLVFGLVVPDFVIFMSNTKKLEQKLQNLAPAFKVFTLKQREYEEIIKTIMSTPEFQYNFTEKEISVEEVEDLLKELAETRRVTVKTLTIDAKRVIPINFFGTPISQPSVKITLELERVKQ